ncbi:MAG: MerR family transcriptional regulator [Methylophilaceae bacterium]|nr:MerR family transcriptional regulator [Methylophilaceae bacterium]
MANENTLQSANGEALTGVILDEQTGLTLTEICRACAVHAETIAELVEEGLLAPEGGEPDQWRFSSLHLRHAHVALRLQRDLGINFAGVALAIQLLDELEVLRRQHNAPEVDNDN